MKVELSVLDRLACQQTPGMPMGQVITSQVLSYNSPLALVFVEIARIPQTIMSLTEIWAGKRETEFLVAINFWGKDKNHIISVCTEGEEAELMNLSQLRQRIDEMIFSYGILSHQL